MTFGLPLDILRLDIVAYLVSGREAPFSFAVNANVADELQRYKSKNVSSVASGPAPDVAFDIFVLFESFVV